MAGKIQFEKAFEAHKSAFKDYLESAAEEDKIPFDYDKVADDILDAAGKIDSEEYEEYMNDILNEIKKRVHAKVKNQADFLNKKTAKKKEEAHQKDQQERWAKKLNESTVGESDWVIEFSDQITEAIVDVLDGFFGPSFKGKRPSRKEVFKLIAEAANNSMADDWK